MFTFILVLLLAAVTLTSISIQKTYKKVPLKELKRRANKGDEMAAALHQAVAYGASLDVLLWVIIGISASAFFVVLTSGVADWLAIFGSAALLWFGFAWLPDSKVSSYGQNLTKYVTPGIAWILSHSFPVINKVAEFVQKHKSLSLHSGLYQKEDLVDLLDKQQSQPDNRMSAYEIGIVKSALVFSDKSISEVMTPKRMVKTVSANDSVGPLLLDELHKSGFSRFPVTGEKPDDIIGTLYLRDLVQAKTGGKVKELMKKTVYYVNEEKPLQHALQAFLKTKHHLFIVVNGFEEVVGIITIEDVLEQVLGKQIIDEFDKYEDLRAVAALEAAKEAKTHKHTPDAPDEIADEEKSADEKTSVESKPKS